MLSIFILALFCNTKIKIDNITYYNTLFNYYEIYKNDI